MACARPICKAAIVKATDFSGAIAEMEHFGLAPAAPIAVAVIVLELGASVMILTGFYRWLAALALGGFTLMATLIALRFWELPRGPRAVHGRECLLRASRAGRRLHSGRVVRFAEDISCRQRQTNDGMKEGSTMKG